MNTQTLVMQTTVLTAVSASAAEFSSQDSRELVPCKCSAAPVFGEFFHAAFRSIVFSIVPVVLLPFCP